MAAAIPADRNIKFIRRGGIHPARGRLRRRGVRRGEGTPPYERPGGRRPPVRAGHKTRTEQAPLSKGARAEIGGLPPGKLPPPGAPPQRALPSANGISRRSNPSVLASLGHLPLTREAKTVPAAANRADMESAPTRVCSAARFAGRCKHRPLHRFVIAHGRSHPGRPQHRRGWAAPAAFCRIILPFRRAACYNRKKPPHKTHQGGRRWN